MLYTPQRQVAPGRQPLLYGPKGQIWRGSRPLKTHWEEVSCQEYQCDGYKYGFRSVLPSNSDLCDWIRHNSGRAFTEARIDDTLTQFDFKPGQQCFISRPTGNGHWLLKRELFVPLMWGRGETRPRVVEPNQFKDTYFEARYQLKRFIQGGNYG